VIDHALNSAIFRWATNEAWRREAPRDSHWRAVLKSVAAAANAKTIMKEAMIASASRTPSFDFLLLNGVIVGG
jgi:hypothetical protein